MANPINKPTLIENSYFFSTNSNPRFGEAIEKHLPAQGAKSEINWWHKNNSESLHCTLGFFFSKATQPQVSTVKSSVENQISNIPFSLFLKVKGCQITKNGWAILTFEESKKVKGLHNKILSVMEQCNLKPSKFSGENYMAHVSIGNIKPGADQQKAFAELQQVCEAVKNNPFPFVVFDLHLNKVENQQDVEVVAAKLPRRDIGIKRVVDSKGTHKIVEFDDVQKANKFARKLFKYYNFQTIQGNAPKTVRSQGNLHTILLTNAEFAKACGHFENLRV